LGSELPAGTVTFVFTDVEGSTLLLGELGAERYADALSEHRRLVREACARHGGIEVDTQGDAFFLAFPTALGALEAAADAQRALAEGPIRVRIGIHTGTPHLTEEGYVGADVHRAARIAAAAHGGQVVVSASTAALVDPDLLRELGEHRLKDLSRPQELHQLLVEGLPAEFPALRTLDRLTTNLPVQPGPLIGRERELRETRDLLAATRVLTLTGPGGTGKTRLAVQLAADVLEDYSDGVFFVDLADIVDPALVAPTVAQTIEFKERGVDPAEALPGYLAEKGMLIVLDNVEQVVEAAPAVGKWAAGTTKVLATGRTPLRIAGEQEYPVPPLPDHAAVELFAERARAVRPDFILNGDRGVVAEICARLDDLPLAIELAAARVKILPPSKLLERLDQRLPVLTGGARDAPARHRTLRAAIDWSFGLLDEHEQELFARLSVFAGGCTLEAAEAVCDATLDDLASLVEKSLLTQGDEARCSMLETVREYAREQLVERAEVDAIAGRHARYFLELAEELVGEASEESADRTQPLYREVDNLRRAREWFVGSDDAEGELRLATAAHWGLWTRWNLRELRSWLDAALSRADEVDAGMRTAALGAVALAAANSGDREDARAYASESLALARERGDKRQIEWALRVLSFDEPDPEEKRRLLAECERLCRELGNEPGLGWVSFLCGLNALEEYNLDEAEERLGEAVMIFGGLGRRWEAANAEVALGHVLLSAGRRPETREIAVRAVETGLELDSIMLLLEAFVLLAAVRVEADPAAAARLLRVVRSHEEEEGLPLDPRYVLAVFEWAESEARARLGDSFEREWEAGAGLAIEDAVALALGRR